MKFYFPSNVPEITGRAAHSTPFIRLYRNGTITLSVPAAELLDVKNGDKISIAHDEENNEFYITKNSEGFPIRAKDGRKGTLTFQCAFLSRKVLGDLDVKSARMNITKEPRVEQKQKLYAILTSSAK